MKSKNTILIFLIINTLLLISCIKHPDIPNTTTEVQGYVLTDKGDTLKDFGVCIYYTQKYIQTYPDLDNIDTIVYTDSSGYYYIKKNLDKYKDYKYDLATAVNKKYGISSFLRLEAGNEYNMNLVVKRAKIYCVVNGKVTDIQSIPIQNIKVYLINVLKAYNDEIVENQALTDSVGKFNFEFQWTDTLQLLYKIRVRQTELYQKSEDYIVVWGEDNYFEIKLQPLK
jgi:hypothetical protein